MRIWIDDVRPAPDHTWCWCRSVYEAKSVISEFRWGRIDIEVIQGKRKEGGSQKGRCC